MHLLIRAVSLAGQPLTQAISAYFDERGGTIGRSDTNTLALPDPERRISRLQAEVSRGADGWRVLNVGNANPIWHNNRPVPPGESVLLDENDELQIGTYALNVTYSKNDATARTITKGRAAVDSRTVIVGSGQEPRTDPSLMRNALDQTTGFSAPVAPPATPAAPVAPAAPMAPASAASSASPFADLLGALSPTAAPSPAMSPFGGPVPAPAAASGGSSSSPFADLLGGFGSPSPAPSAAPASAPATANRLPDDFDPFADFQSAPSPSGRATANLPTSWDLPAAPAPSRSASPFDLGGSAGQQALPGGLDLGRAVDTAGGQSLDQLFGLGGGTSTEPMASFLKKTAPGTPQEAAAGTPISVDPLSLIKPRAEIEAKAEPAPEPSLSHSALADDVPELHAAMALPQALVKAPVPAPAPREAQRDVLEASFSFMPPPKAAQGSTPAAAPPVSSAPATPDGGSPFADLGLGTPAKSGLLDDLDLAPKTIPGIHLTASSAPSVPKEPEAADLPIDLGLPAAAGQPDFEQTALAPQTAEVKIAVAVSVPTAAPAPETAASLAPNNAAANLTNAADNAALWAAFCEGAGIQFTPPQGLNPDLMRVIGQLLKHTVDGSLKLVAARAATKQEMRAEVTVIQARRNNPLKFSPDAQSALEQLLQPPLRGFMTGPEAVSDAMDDLLGHTIGTMVGMRAALEGVLGRFEPSQLESKLVGHSMLDSLLPMNRRAKLWELYLQHFEGVRTEAQDDFHNLFGRAFLQAYEEQLDRLEAERRQPNRAANKPA